MEKKLDRTHKDANPWERSIFKCYPQPGKENTVFFSLFSLKYLLTSVGRALKGMPYTSALKEHHKLQCTAQAYLNPSGWYIFLQVFAKTRQPYSLMTILFFSSQFRKYYLRQAKEERRPGQLCCWSTQCATLGMQLLKSPLWKCLQIACVSLKLSPPENHRVQSRDEGE